jgi:hypothetical protein
MTVSYKGAVQDRKDVWVECDFGDLASGTFVGLVYLPAGAVVVGGSAYSLTASDAATSETIAGRYVRHGESVRLDRGLQDRRPYGTDSARHRCTACPAVGSDRWSV